MAVVLLDGKVKVSWVTSIANTSAPTAAELIAGASLENLILPDGLDVSISTNSGPTGNLGSRWATERAGTAAVKSSVTCHRDSAGDTAWTTLTYGTTGHLVIRRGIAKATAFAAAQKVEVYPMECGQQAPVNPKPDQANDFNVPLFLTGDPVIEATVA